MLNRDSKDERKDGIDEAYEDMVKSWAEVEIIGDKNKLVTKQVTAEKERAEADKYLMGDAFNPKDRGVARKSVKGSDTMKTNVKQNYASMVAIQQVSKSAIDSLTTLANHLQDLGQTAHARKVMELAKETAKVGSIVAKKYG